MVVMAWSPGVSADVVIVAEPPVTGTMPIETPLSKNSTLPTGVEESPAVTTAVKVTGEPSTDGLVDEVRVVVVDTGLAQEAG